MEMSYHRFSELFAQLGLPSDEAGIRNFLLQHSPLPPEIFLEDAPFWNESQAAFLKEEKVEDADWAEIIDQLNSALRKKVN
ncbi:MAG: DUF2789 domain-containing protein [Advenella sp.]|nr:DUF2789 domain-containing protein [Advenella sp.]